MNKIIFSIYFLISLFTLSIKSASSFYIDVNNSYEKYEHLLEVDNASYSIILVKGEYNNKLYLGLYFSPNNMYEYEMRLKINNSIKQVNTNLKRNDIYAVFIDISENDIVELLLYHNNKYTPLFNQDIYTISKQFSNVGMNNGSEVTFLKNHVNYNDKVIFYGIAIFLGIGALVIILVFALVKKGQFRPKEKKSVAIKAKVSDVSRDNTTNIAIKSFDLEQYLYDRYGNFPLNKLLLEEKKELMTNLIQLLDENKITKQQYEGVIVCLWKQ